ncbi:DUF3995 domain-containing protein [Brevibacillus sp. SYSU BS000544]|uniref:DUF3995 domain-containing protein n=1 Tax=Brevibacillus sp. SYSU BS000544 TaxID=3416443 RepID=UPI003CE5AF55
MIFFLAVLVSLCLVVIGSIHVYWIFGGKKGAAAAIPTKDNIPLFKPTIAGTAFVAILLWIASVMLLIRASVLHASIPEWIASWFCWAMVVAFYGRVIGEFHWVGIFKKYKHSTFARYDTKLFTPLCFLLGTFTLIILLNS